jgi:hypothetical protein
MALGAPTVLAIAESFFLANETGPYKDALANPNVCALLELRTQLYTLVIVYFFFAVQFVEMTLLQVKTSEGGWHWPRLKEHKHYGHCLALFVIVSLGLWYLFANGLLMTSGALDSYRALRSCSSFHVSSYEFPPLDTWITISRFGVGIMAFVITYLDRRHARISRQQR